MWGFVVFFVLSILTESCYNFFMWNVLTVLRKKIVGKWLAHRVTKRWIEVYSAHINLSGWLGQKTLSLYNILMVRVSCGYDTWVWCGSTITEEREVSWSRQHHSRTGPSRWRGYNHRSHDNLQQDLADRRMASPMDPVLSHHTSQERQLTAVPELPNDRPHQSPKQRHAEDRTEQIEATSGFLWKPSK